MSPSPSIPTWLVSRLSHLDLNHDLIAKCFQHLAHEGTPKDNAILAKVDQVADAFSLDDELLDGLMARIALQLVFGRRVQKLRARSVRLKTRKSRDFQGFDDYTRYARRVDLSSCMTYNAFEQESPRGQCWGASARDSDDYLNGSPVALGGPFTSKPTWWNTFGCSATSAFFMTVRGARRRGHMWMFTSGPDLTKREGKTMDTQLIILIVVLFLLFGGGGGYYWSRGRG